jgi:uroporphyrinogen decarboxylase
MTSRERVLTSIAHQTPDRVPVDLGATRSSGISAIAYSNLVKHLGLDLPVQIYDTVQQVARPHDEILDLFGVDVIDIGRIWDTEPSDWYPTTMANGAEAFYPNDFHAVRQPDDSYLTYDDDGKRALAKMPQNGAFFDQLYFPYIDGYPADYSGLDTEMGRVMWARYGSGPWNHAEEENFWQKLREKTLYLRQHTDKALMILVGCNLFEWGCFLRRMDNFLMDILCDPYHVEELRDQLVERHLAKLEKICAAVGDIVDLICIGDDLGMSAGPFMDADTYKQLFKPGHKALCDFIKAHSTTMHTYIHSCGSISNLIPDLIDAGIEIFNPVQTNALNMSPAFLKKEFGKDCTFWGGGIENVGTLNVGSRQQIRDMVFERLEIFSAGGGYVFNTVHNILPDVPPENIVTMFEAVKEFNNRNK